MEHKMSTNAKALKVSAVLIFVYFFAEIFVAVVTGSLSLFADAVHELSTVVAISISLIAMRLARRPATAKRTFGLLRAEALAALFNGALLVAMAGFIMVRGVARLADPVEMDPGPMFIMAIGGIGLEIGSLVIMYRGQRDDLNIRASFWHVMNAFMGSVAVIIAATFIAVAEIYQADTWAGMIFAVVLLVAAYGIVRDALRILVDATPRDTDLLIIGDALSAIPGVQSTHHLHSRVVTGKIRTFSGHLVVDQTADQEVVLRQAKDLLDETYGFSLSTIQVEPASLSESSPDLLEYQHATDSTHAEHGGTGQ